MNNNISGFFSDFQMTLVKYQVDPKMEPATQGIYQEINRRFEN